MSQNIVITNLSVVSSDFVMLMKIIETNINT